jgi:hypothetical protein
MKNSKVNQVATFEKLLGFCNTQSAVYKPSKASIQLTALNTLLTQAQQSMKAVDSARISYENAINTREPLFQRIPKLGTRIINSLKASGASTQSIEDASAIRRRFRNHRRTAVGSPENATANAGTASSRTMSYTDLASMVENFESLVNRVSTESSYKPNEADLQLTALSAFATQLRTANKNVINAHAAWKTATSALHLVLYRSNGIYENGVAVKAYMRSILPTENPQYRQISQFQFIKR